MGYIDNTPRKTPQLTTPALDINALLGLSTSAAQGASAFNLSQVPAVTQGSLASTLLAGKTLNEANAANFYKSLNTVLPDWQTSIIGTSRDAVNKTSAMASELMTGEVPQDVQNAIARQNAEAGISRGVFGQALRYNQAATIGKTSLDLKTAGANMYGSVVSPLASRLLENATKLMPAQTDLTALFGNTFANILKSSSIDASSQSSNALNLAIKKAEMDWDTQLSNFNAAREDATNAANMALSREQFNILHPQINTTSFKRPQITSLFYKGE